MSSQLKLIDSRSVRLRACLLIAAAALLIAGVYGARWQFGRMLAENFRANERGAKQNAYLAASLAPDDAQARLAQATVDKNQTDEPQSLREFDAAVALSPDDYRWWLEAGRARETAGDTAGGEAAFRRAVELAPNYAYPRWLLGNLLLRANRRADAFAELKRVADSHSGLRQQVFFLIWEASDGDDQQLKQLFGDSPQVRAALALFYANRSLSAQSLAIWQTLTAAEKADNAVVGAGIARAHFERQNLAAAAVVSRDLKLEAVDIGQITNPSFEADIGKPDAVFFDWRIEQRKNLDLALDPRGARAGQRSLRLRFSGYSEPTLQAAPQFVAVEQGARYHLSFAVKTADLKSAGTPYIEIADAKTLKTLGATNAFAAGTSDWQTLGFDFTVPPGTDGVLLRTVRVYCGENCLLVGTIWYDDFKLERLK